MHCISLIGLLLGVMMHIIFYNHNKMIWTPSVDSNRRPIETE